MKRMIPAVAAAATAMAIAVTIGGCASKPSATSPGSGPAALHAPTTTKNDCTDVVASFKAGTPPNSSSQPGDLPPDAHPVSLMECVQTTLVVPGQGEWQVVNTVRSTGSIDGFVSALRAAYVKPPAPTSGNTICPAVGYVQDWIVLVDADGTAYRIRTPFWGSCPAPDPGVVKALAAVKTTIAATDRIRQTESAGAQASGCPQQFAEMAYATAQMSVPNSNRPFFTGADPALGFRACYYKLAGASDKHDPKPAGDFVSATTIIGTPATTVYDGLTNAPVVTGKACDAPASQYVVLFGNAGKGDWSVVQLDGCRLAASGAGPDRRTPAPVLQLLTAAAKQ